MSDAAVVYNSPFEALGGEAGLRRLCDAFYTRVDQVRRPAPHPRRRPRSHACASVRLAERLDRGAAIYAKRHPGRPCIVSAHAAFRIGAADANQWLACMHAAMAATATPEPWRSPLDDAFARTCEGLRTTERQTTTG